MHRVAAAAGPARGPGMFALHVGVNTGPGVARSIGSGGRADYAVLGESVILAQRVQSLAPAGQTYVGPLTRELAGAEFEFEPLGPQRVKGRAEPIELFRVGGPRRSRVRTARLPMHGRAAELAVLVEALGRARAGATVVAQLTGPAGSGKSRLLEELGAHAAAAGTLVVEVVGSPYQRSTFRRLAPLFIAALLARYPDTGSTEEALRLLAGDPDAPAPARFTRILTGHPDPDDPVDDRVAQGVRRELGAAADAWLGDLAARQPVVIAVDNLQWLEPSSAELLDELADRRTDRPVLFCLCGRRPPRRRDRGTVVTVGLTSLGPGDVRGIVVDELGADPDQRLTEFVADTSRGNPLMARELVRLLRDEDLLDARLGHVRLIAGTEPASVPTSLRALLGAQIDGLHPQLVRVATAAAAIGLTIDLSLFAAVADGADSTRRAIDQLVDAGFLVATGPMEVGFDTPLLRDLLYARMTARRRRTMHARIAAALEADPRLRQGTTALRALHLYRAGDAAAALPLLRQVADQSRRVFAHDDAARALGRAVDAARTARPDLVAELLADLADVRLELGEYEQAAELYGKSLAAGGDARAWTGQGACLRRLGRYGDAVELLRRAVAARPAGDRRMIWNELAASLSVSGDLAGSIEAARSGLALGAADDGLAGRLLSQLVRSLTLLGRLDEARDAAERAVRNLRAAGDLAGECTALRLLGSLEQAAGSLTDAALTLEEGLALAERAGVVEEIGGCLINLGIVRGELDQHAASGDCYARAAATFEQTGNRAGQATAHGNRAYALWRLGDPATAREVAGRALDLAHDVGNHYTAADIATTLALIAESEHEPALAVHWAETAAAEFVLAGMPDAAAESRAMAQRLSGP